MPEGEVFWNPYRMVPVRRQVERTAPITDEKWKGTGGIAHCSVESLTSIFVGEESTSKSIKFVRRNNRFVIPGSSLKGMLRSLGEIVGGGCFVTGRAKDNTAPIPPAHLACNKNRELCVTCRMFGMMGRGSNAAVHKGNVSLGDALIRDIDIKPNLFEIMQMSHGTRHESFYVSPDSRELDGLCRKIYFHQPQRKNSVPEIPNDIRRRNQDQIKSIEALPPGIHFDFDVHFANLTHEELELLTYILALEDHVDVEMGDEKLRLRGPMRHKIGHAKALGLGSVHIAVERLDLLPAPGNRFVTLAPEHRDVFEGDALKYKIAELTRGIVSDDSATMQHLRKVMVWDEEDPRQFMYPSYHWFNNPTNAGKYLKRI